MNKPAQWRAFSIASLKATLLQTSGTLPAASNAFDKAHHLTH
jgi:hypothetical protein